MLSYHYNAVAHRNADGSNPSATLSSEGAKRILFKDFGGKKAMQVLDRKEKMKVNVDVVKDALDKTLLGESPENIHISEPNCSFGCGLRYRIHQQSVEHRRR